MDNNNSISIIGGNGKNKGALLMLYESLKIIEYKNYQKYTPTFSNYYCTYATKQRVCNMICQSK